MRGAAAVKDYPTTKAGKAVAAMLAELYEKGTFARGVEARAHQLANEDIAAVEQEARRAVVERIRARLAEEPGGTDAYTFAVLAEVA